MLNQLIAQIVKVSYEYNIMNLARPRRFDRVDLVFC